ncbi:MAG TPA: hypothetical protein DGG95_03560 [Cytophagales bacterium]|jgi:uncharacterized protein YdhG (YjbR/CyaY superfamily)|nr:hypothetical protein [Cytophagales bacterium]
MKSGKAPSTIDEYIADQPVEHRGRLEKIRETIHKAAPKAQEVISYSMPAFKQNGVLVYFALFKNHIGFFPTGSGVAAFEKELKDYKTSKGSIQFPHDKKLPIALITKITKFRAKEDEQKMLSKKSKIKK